jgi:magnesium chelatase family protein
MMITAALAGIKATAVTVEVMQTRDGLPRFVIAGMGDAATRECRVRVTAALAAVDVTPHQVLITMTPAVGNGAGYDLPIALAFMEMRSCAAFADLGLDGSVRPVRGALARVEALKAAGHTRVIVARDNAAEAALVAGVTVQAVATLTEAMTAVLNATAFLVNAPAVAPSHVVAMSMSDVRGNDEAIAAVRAAVQTGRGVLLIGPMGAGKTMIARRAVSLMPEMTREESEDVTRVASAAGLNVGGGLVTTRPFRAPHHSTSPAGLVGGGASEPRPGEASIADHGVLFLDEIVEFSRAAIEALQPVVQAKAVTLSRAAGAVSYPARCTVIATASACPCGRLGSLDAHGVTRCRCTPHERERHDNRVSLFASALGLDPVRVEPVDLAAL